MILCNTVSIRNILSSTNTVGDMQLEAPLNERIMRYFDEAFPNSNTLFNQAFDATNPVPILLKLLNDHPTYFAIRDLLTSYTKALFKDRSRGQHLASCLAMVCNSPDATAFGTETLASLVDEELADRHFKVNYGPYEVKAYGPENTHLFESLLSGLSLKYRLTSSSTMYASIDAGLDARPGSDDAQVLVVGTCIQLLLHGSELVTEEAGTYRKTAEKVASKLKDQKAMGTMTDPHAIELLEVCNSFQGWTIC